MVLRAPLLLLAAITTSAFAATNALADTIVPVTSQSALAPNDSVSWDQLGPDATALGSKFNATSAGGLNIGGSFTSGGGQVCDNAFDSCSFAFSDYSIQAFDTGSGSGSGPLTLTVPGVSGVGTNIVNAVGGGPFSASLSLYNGSTLLGTVTAASDSGGDPVYLGALDQTGANVTSAVFSLTSIGAPAQPATTATFIYDPNAGFRDPNFCAPTTAANFDITTIGGVRNALQCPQKYNAVEFAKTGVSPWPITVPIALDPTPFAGESPNVSNTTNASPDTFDTNPNDLANLFIDGVDIVDPTTTSLPVPEPGTLFLLGTALVGLHARRRRARSRTKLS